MSKAEDKRLAKEAAELDAARLNEVPVRENVFTKEAPYVRPVRSPLNQVRGLAIQALASVDNPSAVRDLLVRLLDATDVFDKDYLAYYNEDVHPTNPKEEVKLSTEVKYDEYGNIINPEAL